MDRMDTIERARNCILQALPGIDLSGVQFGTYTADRAEGTTEGGARPEGPSLLVDANVMTTWPTKLALVPMLCDAVQEAIPVEAEGDASPIDLHEWPRPSVALPPWEREETWTDVHSAAVVST